MVRKDEIDDGMDYKDETDESTLHTECSTEPSSRGLGRMVSFGQVEIRYYPMELGEKPSVSAGPPVQLCWEHEDVTTHDIDLFEWERGPCRCPRGCTERLALNHHKRINILRLAGHSLDEIEAAEAMIQKQRHQGMSLLRSALGKLRCSVKRKVDRGLRRSGQVD